MATRDSGGQDRASKVEQVDEVAGEPAADQGGGDVQDRVGKLAEDVDSLLDEIDDVLEENAEDFVKSYVQKGGQ
jgi:ubiquitin-like protein Pup